ncbi:MAG: hypothetical protein GY938_04060 [Ketobacter sp.]|nr:hypothetical protein [Ketobacter sp.]
MLGLVQVTIGANPLTAPTISGLAPAGKVAEAYSFTPTTTGSGLTFAIDAIPAGLSFSTSTGELSGDGVSAPTPAGTYSFTITVTNSAGAASKGYTLIIDAADVVTPPVTVTAGNLLAVYFDADNNEQQLQFDVSSFDEIDNENNIVAEADNKANFEVTYLGGRDEYPIKVPDIKPGVVDDYTTFRNAMRIGRSVTITDPNNIRPHIEFPLLARTTKTPVLSDLNRCGSMTLTCTLWRIVS